MDKYFTANAILSIFSKYYMELKQGLPIRPSEMGVLNIITETPGPHTPVLLAGLLGVSKPMITAHLTNLSKKGYIEKKQSLEDKRIFYIFPTEKTFALVESAKADLDQHIKRLEKEMGQDEFDSLIRLAQKANKILETGREEKK